MRASGAVMERYLNAPLFDVLDTSALPDGARWPGRLGLTELPGQRLNLATDLAAVRSAWAVDTFAVLVEDAELVMLGCEAIVEVAKAAGIEVLRLPIREGSVPDDALLRPLLDEIRGRLLDGQTVGVACRAGLGRTGTVVACLCIDAGLDAEVAISLVRHTRPGAIETHAQEAFVRGWASSN